MKKLIGLVFAVMVFVLPGVKVWAAEAVSYIYYEDDAAAIAGTKSTGTCLSYTTVTEQTKDWNNTSPSNGWYVVSDDVTINDRITATGTVNLIIIRHFISSRSCQIMWIWKQ